MKLKLSLKEIKTFRKDMFYAMQVLGLNHTRHDIYLGSSMSLGLGLL